MHLSRRSQKFKNAQLANTSILNWSKRRVGRRIKMSLGITYNTPIENRKLQGQVLKTFVKGELSYDRV